MCIKNRRNSSKLISIIIRNVSCKIFSYPKSQGKKSSATHSREPIVNNVRKTTIDK